jgi:hypothetical protein
MPVPGSRGFPPKMTGEAYRRITERITDERGRE